MDTFLFPLAFFIIVCIGSALSKKNKKQTPAHESEPEWLDTNDEDDETLEDDTFYTPHQPQKPVQPPNRHAPIPDAFAEILKAAQKKAEMKARQQAAEQKRAERTAQQQTAQQQTPASPRQIVAQSIATAFPKAMKAVKATRPGVHHPVHVNARGRDCVRQGVLMAEVLSHPRAYDL